MLIPTGFWSYTTADDTSSRGKLSQLRALLAAELQQQVGGRARVNIFQDVAAIPPGAEWERQIRESIERASFIIPIVTPGFLDSEWCCREVTLFREREKRLGVGDLVFPIHYVDTVHLDGGDQEVLGFLRTRQWIDFRHLRFRSLESEEVALLLENLSKGILKALREASLMQQRGKAERQREEAAWEAAGAKQREQAEREALAATEARQREKARQAEETRQREEARRTKAGEAERRSEEEVREADKVPHLQASGANSKLGEDREHQRETRSEQKSLLISYLLWLFLGGLGGHRIYNGRIGSAVGQAALLALAMTTNGSASMGHDEGTGALLKSLPTFGVGLWFLVDAFLIPGWVRAANETFAGQPEGR